MNGAVGAPAAATPAEEGAQPRPVPCGCTKKPPGRQEPQNLLLSTRSRGGGKERGDITRRWVPGRATVLDRLSRPGAKRTICPGGLHAHGRPISGRPSRPAPRNPNERSVGARTATIPAEGTPPRPVSRGCTKKPRGRQEPQDTAAPDDVPGGAQSEGILHGAAPPVAQPRWPSPPGRAGDPKRERSSVEPVSPDRAGCPASGGRQGRRAIQQTTARSSSPAICFSGSGGSTSHSPSAFTRRRCGGPLRTTGLSRRAEPVRFRRGPCELDCRVRSAVPAPPHTAAFDSPPGPLRRRTGSAGDTAGSVEERGAARVRRPGGRGGGHGRSVWRRARNSLSSLQRGQSAESARRRPIR